MMPLISTCAEHPEYRGTNVTDDMIHLHAEHGPDARLGRGGPITTTLVGQHVAQGNPTRYRFACRRCACMVDTTTRPDPTAAYCEDCTP